MRAASDLRRPSERDDEHICARPLCLYAQRHRVSVRLHNVAVHCLARQRHDHCAAAAILLAVSDTVQRLQCARGQRALGGQSGRQDAVLGGRRHRVRLFAARLLLLLSTDAHR